MAPKIPGLLIVAMVLFAPCILLGSCSKSEADLEEVERELFDLNSPGAIQAAARLSAEGQQLLGAWQLSIEGGNQLFYEVPQEIFLLPFANPPSRRPKYFVLKPELPEMHPFRGDTYWTLNDQGDLVLWWIKLSGIRATLQPVDENKWEGVIEEVWDFPKKSVSKSVTVERKVRWVGTLRTR
ncbi:MAG: hypothetical protein HQ519_13910 [Planctomycetes bacterium]|nr:hypothetical protein [Planctomycetota bacterium]